MPGRFNQKTLIGLEGFEFIFNGQYFHHPYYLKTSVSRNDLSPGYSEQDTRSVVIQLFSELVQIYFHSN